MTGLAVSDWIAIANIASPVVLGAIGYLIKRSLADMDRRITAMEVANKEDDQARACYVEQHRIEHRELEGNVVGKEDWLRESGMARQRQEMILGELQILRGKQEMGVEIATAIAAALNRQAGPPAEGTKKHG